MLNLFTLLNLGLVVLGLLLLKRVLSPKPAAPLPPGPKPLPILGNVMAIPSNKEWETFTKWGEKWGDITSVSVFGQTIIVVNSAKVAFDMMDKKSAIYSDRPIFQMGGELVGWKNALGLLPYGVRFRNYRRLLHQLIGSQSTMKQFYPIEEMETRRFLKRLLGTPEDLAAHIRMTAGAIILRLSYGWEVRDENDYFVKLAETAMEQFSITTTPGAFLVDIIPALKYLPDWFPGAGFKRKAKAYAKSLQNLVNQPHNYVKQQMAAGTALKSFTSTLMNEKEVTADEEFDIKWSAVSVYAGGADTTVATIYALFLAMILYPEVQKNAQAEIDAVVGSDRLPTFEDREHLPYVNAVCKEILRWHIIGPTGIPHRAIEDNIHEGYLIPKGAVIIPNVWKMTHDPATYSNPMIFDPSRFIGSEEKAVEKDPSSLSFGFGRRACPGRILAETSIFISAVMTLSVFDITKFVDSKGVVYEPVHEQMTGTISHPKPFKCTIKPRSEKATALIQSENVKLAEILQE